MRCTSRSFPKLGIDTTLFADDSGDKLKEATFTNTNEFGNAYPGSSNRDCIEGADTLCR